MYNRSMAKDDYYVIVYCMLSYLYDCLKKGQDIDRDKILPSGLFDIDGWYWFRILKHMIDRGYIDGVRYEIYEDGGRVTDLEQTQITPDGIEYLLDNKHMRHMAKILKDRNRPVWD